MNDAIKKLLDLFPNMEIGEDNDGQVIVYTGMRETQEGNLVAYTEAEGRGE